jgi:hypothetical protein
MLLGTPAAPLMPTPRLRLRGWRPDDFEPYAALLADAETARFNARDIWEIHRQEWLEAKDPA